MGGGLASRLARASLAAHPARALFAVLGIGVGVATVVGLYTLDHNTLLGRAQSEDPDWRAEIEVSPSLSVQRPREELERLPGVGQIAAAFQAEATLAPAGVAGPFTGVTLIALEAGEARGLGAYRVELGADLGPSPQGAARPDQALVGEGLARRLGLAPGARVLIARPRGAPARECVGGEWRTLSSGAELPERSAEFEVVGVLAREGLGRRSAGDVVVIPFEAGRRLYADAHVETRYWLGHDPSVNLERLQSSLGQAWSYDLRQSVVIGQAADERAFRNGVRYAGMLALVLGLYVIFHTLSVALVERVREVGLLHALGATRTQIGRVFLLEAAVVAGLGGLAGLAGGLALARVLLLAGVSTVGRGFPIRVFEVPWGTVLALFAAGVGIALAGSVYPLAKARNTDAVRALRGEDAGQARRVALSFRVLAAVLLALVLPGLYFGAVPLIGEAQKELLGVLLLAVGVLALLVAVPLVAPALLSGLCAAMTRPLERWWPLSGRLAARAMARGPVRVAGGIAGIALVTAGYVGLRGMTSSLEAEIRVWGERAFLDKHYGRNLPRTDFETLARRLEAVPGVLGVEPNEARTYVPFLLLGVREEHIARYGPLSEDPGLLARLQKERGLILSTRLANHRGYSLGDSVPVRTPRGDVVELPVLAISDAYGYFPHPDERLYAVISDRWMRELFCVDSTSVSSFSVRLDQGADRASVETAVRSLVPSAPITFESGPYLYRWHAADVRRDFVLFDILVFLTAALAGLGILNGQLLAALEHQRELGLLKALGASRRQLAGTVLIESAGIGLIGGATGIALGSALSPVIVAALRVLSGLPLAPGSAGSSIAWALLGALGVALASGLYPVWRMQRSDVLASVRTGGV